MFIQFYYTLKESGIPVSPTAFLMLQKALGRGLIASLDDFYTAARTILVKSERYFDLFDRIFAHHFEGAELPAGEEVEPDGYVRGMLAEWLEHPRTLAQALGMDEADLARYTPDELVAYFKERLKEQKERHDGGSRWIGTGGTSPVGHSGIHPGGMRVGGASRGKSAVKTALERRYKDYDRTGPLNRGSIGEALKRLRDMRPVGVRDRVNIEASVYQTMKNAGEIEIVFDRSFKDRLKVILAIDNGGWSMDPHVPTVQTLFDYARAGFKDLRIFYFHNTIYDHVWEDPARRRRPQDIDGFARLDPETRFMIVGDAGMAPYELLSPDGSIYVEKRSGKISIERLKFIARNFRHSAWLNPTPVERWKYTRTIGLISEIFPMFELTLDGLQKAVSHLMSK
jgi:uncharacterized protein